MLMWGSISESPAVPRAFPPVHVVRFDHRQLLANRGELAVDSVLGLLILWEGTSRGEVVSVGKIWRTVVASCRSDDPVMCHRSSGDTFRFFQ